MLKATVISLATFVAAVSVSAFLVYGQTSSPTVSPKSVSPTTTVTMPSGAPNTGRAE